MRLISLSPLPVFRSQLRSFTGVVSALLLTLAAAIPALAQQAAVANPARITQAVDDTVLTTLRGNVHPLATPRNDRGPANASLPADRMQLVLKRSPGQEMALRQLLGSMQDTNSAQYRKWLTPEQLGAQYGVSDADVRTVSTWLESRGFKVNKVNKARTIIEFSGSIGQIQTAFHTQIHNFVVGGVQHLANVSDPQIPAALAPVVAGMSGLTDFFPKPQHTKPQLGRYDKASGKLVPQLTTGSASAGYSLFLVPGDAATIYNTPNAFNINFTGSTAYTGSNVTIGIAGDSNIPQADVAEYRANFGLTASAPTVVVDGNDPGINDDVVEALLDLQVSGGLAPGASQIFYTAANTNLDGGLFLAIVRALDDNEVSILNVSFGGCEAFQGVSGNQYINGLWEQAAAQGISVTVSTGDSGSAVCDDDNQQQAQDGLQVNGLASTPFNIAVGGTDFDSLETNFANYVSTTNSANFTSAKKYIPEEPWNDSTSTNGLLAANTPFKDQSGDTNIAAAGGGRSSCVLPQYDSNGELIGCNFTSGTITGWAKPSWQTGGNLNIPSDGVRDLPDLSLFSSDGSYGAAWLVCYTYTDFDGNLVTCQPNSTGEFSFIAVGGTSSSAPAFAGILALVSQSQAGSQGPVRLGQANYVLYNLANQPSLYSSIFNDVTTGNNSVYCVPNSLDCGSNFFESGYDAGTNYDLASGLGSLNVTELVDNWTKAAFSSSTTTFTVNGGTAPVSITHGQAVTFDVTVAGAGATPVPSGDVAIIGDANQQANTYGANSITGYTLSAGTTGAQTYNNLPGGTYTVNANYGGDITFAQSQSTPGVQVTVAKENSVVDVSGTDFNGNPLTISGSYPYGTYFGLEAQPVGASQVNSATPAPATGTVTFADTGGALPGSGSGSAAGAVTLNSNGYAELPLYYWFTAAHSVTASYGGDNSFNSSTSTAVAFTITPAPTVSTVTSSAATVGSGTFTLTSVITPNPASGAAYPTGTVIFTANGATLVSAPVASLQDPNTGASLGNVAVSVNATALVSGANVITAAYSGDTNYAASSGTVTVTSTATPTLAIAGAAIPAITAGASGTSAITVTPGGGFTGAVTLTCTVTGPVGATSLPTCSYIPASVTISGTTAATSTLTFTTTATTTAGNYTVALNAAGGTVTATGTLTVTVAAGAPTGTFGISSTAATVSSPGQSGTSAITVTSTSGSGYAGTVKLTCVLATAPNGANATYDPTCALASSVAVTSTTPGTATATFATTAPTTGALAYPEINQRLHQRLNQQLNRWYTAAGGAALACVFFFGIPARRRGWKSMLGLLIFLVTMAGVGCGGGGGGNSSTPGTTTGNYTFTVTGVDSVTAAITTSTTVTVTVN